MDWSCGTAHFRRSAGLGVGTFCWPFIDFAFSFPFLILVIPPLLGAGERQNPFESVRRRSRLYKRSLSEDGDWTDGVSPQNYRDFICSAGSIALSIKGGFFPAAQHERSIKHRGLVMTNWRWSTYKELGNYDNRRELRHCV